ncbi:MAG: toll/interleukin-1 receptor domain-containing protein [Nannocystis sp.]|nr:toll/interleukin-1 receptor domain-containing protein [Nannocystis sp.]
MSTVKSSRIFLSHAHEDSVLKDAFVDLIRICYQVRDEELRCTSTPAYQAPAGVSVPGLLQQELDDAQIFIALITQRYSQRPFCQWELWTSLNARTPKTTSSLFLIMVPPITPAALGPYGGTKSLLLGGPNPIGEIVRFIEDLGLALVRPVSPNVAVERAEKLLAASEVYVAAQAGQVNPPAMRSEMSPEQKELRIIRLDAMTYARYHSSMSHLFEMFDKGRSGSHSRLANQWHDLLDKSTNLKHAMRAGFGARQVGEIRALGELRSELRKDQSSLPSYDIFLRACQAEVRKLIGSESTT